MLNWHPGVEGRRRHAVVASRYFALAALLAGLLPTAGAHAAEPPAGIVMKVTGSTTPPFAAMAEIPANTPIQLAPEAGLTFLHYGKCKLVAVTGGTLTLTRGDFTTDGHVDSERPGPCPTIRQLSGTSAGATSGGMVLRGGAPPRLPVNPEILFVGSRADKIVGASVLTEAGEQPLLSFALAGGRATLSSDSPPLKPDVRYVLRVTISDQPAPLDLTFVARPASAEDSLVVLRVD